MLALLLVALSLGLSNFAAAIGIGISGTGTRTRLRVGVIFGLFEAGMPVAGLALGRSLTRTLGHAAHWTGAALLIATGAWALCQAIRGGPHSTPAAAGQRTGRLIVTATALSIDNLAVGFALGTYPSTSPWLRPPSVPSASPCRSPAWNSAPGSEPGPAAAVSSSAAWSLSPSAPRSPRASSSVRWRPAAANRAKLRRSPR